MPRRAATTEHILDAASALFFEHGFGKVSVDAIALAAGTTKVTVYQHFRAKDEIVVAGLRQRLLARDAALASRFDGRPMSPDILLEFFDWMQAAVTHNRYQGCAFVKAYNELSETLPEVRQVVRQAKQSLRERIVSVAAASSLERPDELGAQLAVLLEGAQTLSFVAHSTKPFKAARAAAINLLLQHGWNPPGNCMKPNVEKHR